MVFITIIGGGYMPGGDGSGPNGMGPMTGRAAGLCAGNTRPGFFNIPGGRRFLNGFGRTGRGPGRGAGRGFRNNYYTNNMFSSYETGNPQDVPVRENAEILKSQAQYLQKNLDVINLRIQELEKVDKRKDKS
jgi:hypothetical protein